MAAFTAAGEAGEAVADHYAIGGHLLAQRRLEEARSELQAVADEAHIAGVVALEARVLGSLATAIGMQGDARTAKTLVERALRLALDANETAAAADVYRRIGTLHEMSSDYAAACDAYETALGFCRTQALPGAARTCMGCMTWALFLAGDWKRAQGIVREVTADPQAPQGSRSVGHLVGGLMAVWRAQPRALEELERSETLARLEQIHSIVWGVAWGRALLAERAGDFATAAGLYRGSIGDWETSDDLVEMVPVLAHAAACFNRVGDRAWLDRTVAGLRRCADGMANAETLAGLARALGEQALGDGRIGELLGLSSRTVDMHVARILDRLGAGTRTEAALLAEEQGLLG